MLLALLAMATIGLMLLPGGARADIRLGGADLAGHCEHLGFDDASLTGPVSGPNAAYGWQCTGPGSAAIDVTAACRWQYDEPNAYALASDLNHAFSWRCYLPDPSPSQVSQLPAIEYGAFDGHKETLIPWQGEEVTLLSAPAVSREAAVMTKLLSAIDRAYRFYAAMTGREPASYFTLNGRTTIAQVTSTCGAGCGFLGATGVEIASGFFEGMYEAAKKELYDQIPFYELGRNFWFYGEQLAFRSPEQDPVISGYAVWMRFESMAAARVDGDMALEKFRGEVESLIDLYEADPSLTFAGTLAQNHSPGPYNGTDFWASIMMRLADRYGGEEFIRRFWEMVPTLDSAASTSAAVSNWVEAASYAACADLSPVFYSRWGFPQPDGSVSTRAAVGAVPDPAQTTCPQLEVPAPDPEPEPEPEGPGSGSQGSAASAAPTRPAGGSSPAGNAAFAEACATARARLVALGPKLRRAQSRRQRKRLQAERRRARALVRALC